MHDFLIKELGRAVPYGIYDLAANAGWVNVGIDNDTAAFAVQTIRRWWQDVGRVRYPLARRLVITADGGGSNGTRAITPAVRKKSVSARTEGARFTGLHRTLKFNLRPRPRLRAVQENRGRASLGPECFHTSFASRTS